MGNAMEKMPAMPEMPALPERCSDCNSCEGARKQLDRICLDNCPRLCEEKKPSGELDVTLAEAPAGDAAEEKPAVPEEKPTAPDAKAPEAKKLPEEETNVSVAVTEPEGEAKADAQRRGPLPMEDAPGVFEESPRAAAAPVLQSQSSASVTPAGPDPRLLGWLSRKGFMAVDTPKRVRSGVRLSTVYPLHVAAEENDRATIALLLSAGAKPSQATSRGKTALDLASAADRNGSHTAVCQLLGAAMACEE